MRKQRKQEGIQRPSLIIKKKNESTKQDRYFDEINERSGTYYK